MAAPNWPSPSVSIRKCVEQASGHLKDVDQKIANHEAVIAALRVERESWEETHRAYSVALTSLTAPAGSSNDE